MTNTTPTNQLPAIPNHLAMLIAAVMDSIESVQPPPLSNEPGFEEYLNNQALLQQLQLAQYHKVCLEVDPSDQAAAAGLHKALALVERSRTRATRPTKPDNNDPKPPTERDIAAEFLKAELLPGPRRVEDLLSRGRLMGISARTLQRAKLSLNIASNLHVMPDRQRYWTWALPEHAHFNDFNPPMPRPKCTLSDAEYEKLKAEDDAYWAAQSPVSDDLGNPLSPSNPVSNPSTQNSMPSTTQVVSE